MGKQMILSPVFERTQEQVQHGVKLPQGMACRIALVSNSKASTNEPLFRGAERVLREKYGVTRFLYVNKESFAKPMLEIDKLRLLRDADLVVNSIGD